MANTDEVIQIGGVAIRFLAEGRDTLGSLAMFEMEVAPAAKVPVAHSHDAYEETLYGLAGVLTLNVEGRLAEIRAGESLTILRGATHRFDNFHPQTSKTLAILTPGMLGPEYFREIAAIVRSSAETRTQPDLAAIGAVMKRHGLTPAP
jgi:quercetin dioxygenase-like cupin family protein